MIIDLGESRAVRVEITRPGMVVRYNIRPVDVVINQEEIYISDVDQELDIVMYDYTIEEVGDGEFILTSGDTEIYIALLPLTMIG